MSQNFVENSKTNADIDDIFIKRRQQAYLNRVYFTIAGASNCTWGYLQFFFQSAVMVAVKIMCGAATNGLEGGPARLTDCETATKASNLSQSDQARFHLNAFEVTCRNEGKKRDERRETRERTAEAKKEELVIDMIYALWNGL
uniref:Uncharacterized protein n=1 Tax=Glossina austeni TaxID=7395 RepID=A0A1A9UJC0_GLOAU